MQTLDTLKEELFDSNDVYRQLVEEHRDCERRLQTIASKSFLSEEDENEEKRIKIHKLNLKDRMEKMLREARTSRVPA